jgi:manganese/iron transport system ATP-binding protein
MMGRTGELGLLRRSGAPDSDRVRESLETVGMLPLAHRQIGELSGGQKQRLFIARALAQEADLVLLDEPLAGLDIPSQEQILKILEQMGRNKVTVLFATHDLELATKHFDKIMLLNRRLVAFGNPTEVLTPKNLEMAYGGHLQVLETTEGKVMIGDSGGHHSHEAQGRHG